MNKRRFRKVSLRLALFVLMPLCAFAFLVGTRVHHANAQLRIMQALEDQSMLDPYAITDESDVWWEAFWGGDPKLAIDYAYITGTPEHWAAIAPLTHLKYLDLDSPPADVTAKQMRDFVKQHPRLERIGLFGSLSEEVWKELGEAKGLRHLHSPEGCNISDVALSYFAEVPLTELILQDCPNLTDRACQSIAKMRSLQKLSLHSTPLTDRGIGILRQLDSLEELTLSETKVTGSGLDVLANMPGLKLLDLSNCPLSAEAFDHIAVLRQLRELHLNATSVNDQQLGRFAHMKDLRLLALKKTNVADEATNHIAKFKHLENLQLSYTRVSDGGLQRLDGLTKLRVLLCECAYVSPMAMNRLADTVTHDRDGVGISLSWKGAACIDTTSGKLVGHVPGFPLQLTNDLATMNPTSMPGTPVFGIFPDKPMAILPGSSTSSDLAPDGDQFMSMYAGLVSVFEVPSGRPVRQVQLGLNGFSNVRALGEHLLTFYYQHVTAWDAATGQQLWKGPATRMQGIDLVRRDNRLALLNLQAVEVITAVGKKIELQRYPSDGRSSVLRFPFMLSVGFDDDGHVIVAQINVQNGPIEIRDLEADKSIAEIPVTTHNAVLSANAKVLATASADERGISIWNASTGEKIADVPGQLDSSRMKLTPDGRYLIVGVPNNVIKPEYR